jgi:hypothetical protein
MNTVAVEIERPNKRKGTCYNHEMQRFRTHRPIKLYLAVPVGYCAVAGADAAITLP